MPYYQLTFMDHVFGVCEECSKQATSMVQDVCEVLLGGYVNVMPSGHIHRFCMTHRRKSMTVGIPLTM